MEGSDERENTWVCDLQVPSDSSPTNTTEPLLWRSRLRLANIMSNTEVATLVELTCELGRLKNIIKLEFHIVISIFANYEQRGESSDWRVQEVLCEEAISEMNPEEWKDRNSWALWPSER